MAEMLKYIILKYSLSSIFLSRYLYFISYTILRSTFQTTSFFLSSFFWLRRLKLQVDAYKKGLNMARQQSSDF